MEEFKSLKEKFDFYRNKTDYKIEKKSYTMVMLDGRSFSKMIKNKYHLPFDDTFINMMNETAAYVCKGIQGCKIAYVQSDEMTFVVTDFENPDADIFFGGRLVKMLSIIPGIATGYFNKLAMMNLIPKDKEAGNILCSSDDIYQMLESYTPIQFDAKVWQVPNLNDVFATILYRQNDCIRNSKAQVAQKYFSHNQLKNLPVDEQIKLTKEKFNVDWENDFDDGKKFGRFIWKETEQRTNEHCLEPFERSVWKSHYAWPLHDPEGKKRFLDLGIIPDIDCLRK
jgi:tRNA(His) 5'-end guanylyltransferase